MDGPRFWIRASVERADAVARRRRFAGGRWSLTVVVVVAAGLAGGTVGTALHSQTTQIIGGRFVLLDSGGVQRGLVEVAPSGEARIVLTGPNSQAPSAAVGIDGEGNAYLQLRDGAGAARARLTTDTDGSTRLALLGGRGQDTRILLREGPDGTAALELRDTEGRPRAVLAVGPEGLPSFGLYDGEGNVQWTVP